MRILIFKKVSTTILCQNLKNLVRVEFDENSVFAKKKNGQNGPEMVLIFHHKPLIWQNCGFQVMGQNVLRQSNCRILYNVSRKEMRDQVAILRHSNSGLVSSGVSLTSWGEGASLALVYHPSSDGFTIKIPYGGRCFITSTSFTPHLFSYWVG